MSQFIFMLTRDDVTIPDARTVLDEVLETDVQHIGFKDVGLPAPEMRALVAAIQEAGRTAHLEVVSLTAADELASASVAIDLGVDYLIGGTRWREVAPRLDGTGITYFPYAGTVFDHPGKLDGTPAEILADVEAMADAVDGANILAYRHVSRDGAELLAELAAGTGVRLIAAGSIDSVTRIGAVRDAGAWGFTIGQAALDGKVVPGGTLADQLNAALRAAAPATREA